MNNDNASLVFFENEIWQQFYRALLNFKKTYLPQVSKFDTTEGRDNIDIRHESESSPFNSRDINDLKIQYK
jgi:hypothetical protein